MLLYQPVIHQKWEPIKGGINIREPHTKWRGEYGTYSEEYSEKGDFIQCLVDKEGNVIAIIVRPDGTLVQVHFYAVKFI